MEKRSKMFSAALLAAFMAGIVSCSKDDESPHLSVEAASGTTFSASGGSIDVSVTSNAVWRIDRAAGEASDWLSVNATQGKESQYVKVYARANTTVNAREATLRFVCTTDESVWQAMTFRQEGEEPSLNVSPESVSLAYEESSAMVKVECNTSWTATADSDWITLSKKGSEGDATLYVKASENTSEDARHCVVVLSMGDGLPKKQVEVTQEGKPEPQLTVTPQTLSFTPYANSTTIRVESNTSWTATIDCDWLTLSAMSGKKNVTLTLNAGENIADDDRQGIILVSVGDGLPQQQIVVTQEGMDRLLYREPMVSWGATRNDVKDYMSNYNILQETDDNIGYYGKYKEAITGYLFDTGRLWCSVVGLSASVTDVSALDAQLLKVGYRQGGKKLNDIPVYYSNDNKTVTLIDNVSSTGVYFVRYYDYSQPFLTPYMAWDAPMSDVGTVMAKDDYVQVQQGMGSDGYYISYYGKRLEEISVYHFSREGKLQETDVFLDPVIVPFDKACNYLTSSLSFSKSIYLFSNYGEVYESRDGNTVALVLEPYYTTSKMVQIAFMSKASAIAGASGSSRNATRSGMSGTIQPDHLKGLPDGLLERAKEHSPDIYERELRQSY